MPNTVGSIDDPNDEYKQEAVEEPTTTIEGPGYSIGSDGTAEFDGIVIKGEAAAEDTQLRELQPDDELWAGGPKWQEILDWKARFGEDSVYVTSISPTRHIVWRTINRLEYRNVVKQVEEMVRSGLVTQAESNLNNEEMIAKMCILYPTISDKELSSDLAGIASLISQEVLEASAFSAFDVRQL